MNYIDVEEDQFIAELNLWIYKSGKYPLELITFIEAKNGQKLIAMPTYTDSEKHIFLGDKGYDNYQYALTRVGSIFDKMDVRRMMQDHIDTHPLSYPKNT